MSYTPCSECKNQRWMLQQHRFRNDESIVEWRPFARDAWDHVGPVERAAAMAAKVLQPCKCNPKRLAPWAKEFQNNASAANGGGYA